MALGLSLVVLMSWPLIMRYLAPSAIEEPIQLEEPAPQRLRRHRSTRPLAQPKKPAPAPPAPLSPNPKLRQLKSRSATYDKVRRRNSDYWRATLSNRGAVATSWILSRYKENGEERTITGADGKPLQLIPQQIPEPLSAPLSLRTPWLPEIAQQLNQVNFQIEGVGPNEKK